MTVQQLIEKLKKVDPDAEAVTCLHYAPITLVEEFEDEDGKFVSLA